MPWLATREARAAWRRDMGAAYAHLKESGEHGVLDPYGAKEPAELFAVAVEAFFENAALFREAHPDLHGHFKQHFGLDPAEW
jgi:Mlc titration factor MtfA (ptsG expression regulator)